MKRPVQQAVEVQNHLAQGRISQEPHIFQVLSSCTKQRTISKYPYLCSRFADLIVARESWPGSIDQISSNIQLYIDIAIPAQNLAMQCPLQAPIENSILYLVWCMTRDHVLISGKVNSFAWHNLDHSTAGASDMMQDSLQSAKTAKTVPHQSWIVLKGKQNK